MNNTSPKRAGATRQRYLSLVSRLYDLASEFADDELRGMIREWASDRNGVRDAIEALVRLHSEFPASPKESTIDSHLANVVNDKDKKHVKDADLSFQFAASVDEVLSNKDLFPTLLDISELLPVEIKPKFKEARSRYITRVIRYLNSRPDRERNLFMKNIRMKLQTLGDDGSFISNWKNLIRDL